MCVSRSTSASYIYIRRHEISVVIVLSDVSGVVNKPKKRTLAVRQCHGHRASRRPHIRHQSRRCLLKPMLPLVVEWEAVTYTHTAWHMEGDVGDHRLSVSELWVFPPKWLTVCRSRVVRQYFPLTLCALRISLNIACSHIMFNRHK